MGKPATKAATKKRGREAAAAAASSSDGGSDGGSGSEQASSSSSSEESDSDDDEVENALFRPAPVASASQEEEGSGSSSSAESGSEAEAEAEDAPVEPEPKAKKPKAAKPAALPDQPELQQEIERKTEATVYVEGIPYSADEGDLVSHFAACGIVKEVRMPRYQDSGKPRGYAHVVFEDGKALAKALKMDGKYLSGRYLTVRQAQTPRMVEMALKEQKTTAKAVKGCRTVFIKQLPYDVEEQAVRDALASCGTIMSVRLPLWNHTKKLKGFGYVEFAKEDEALAATKRTGMKIGGRMAIISLDVAGAPKASFRMRDGQFWSKGEEAKKALAKTLSTKQPRSQSGGAHKKRRTA